VQTFVSQNKKDFFKFWWSQELDCLKTQAMSLTICGKMLADLDQALFTVNVTVINEPIDLLYGEHKQTQMSDIPMICMSYCYIKKAASFGDAGRPNMTRKLALLSKLMATWTLT